MKKKFIILLVILIAIIFIILGFNLLNKEEEVIIEEKQELSLLDFETSLLNSDYEVLSMDKTSDTLHLHLIGIEENEYNLLLTNLKNIMNTYQYSRLNALQDTFFIYIYENDIKYTDKEYICYLEYKLNDSYKKTYKVNLPKVKDADGLYPYEYMEFIDDTLYIKMDLSELTLYQKVSQFKVLSNVIEQLNDKIISLCIFSDDEIYLYNVKNNYIIITEEREL